MFLLKFLIEIEHLIRQNEMLVTIDTMKHIMEERSS